MSNNQKINIFVGKVLKEQTDPVGDFATAENFSLTGQDKEIYNEIAGTIKKLKEEGYLDKIGNLPSDVMNKLGEITGTKLDQLSFWEMFKEPDPYIVIGVGTLFLVASGKIKDIATGTMAIFPMLQTLAKNLSEGKLSSGTLFLLRFLGTYAGINILQDVIHAEFSALQKTIASGSMSSTGLGFNSLMNTRVVQGLKEYGSHMLEMLKKKQETTSLSAEQIMQAAKDAAKTGTQATLEPSASPAMSKDFAEQINDEVNKLKETWKRSDDAKNLERQTNFLANQSMERAKSIERAKAAASASDRSLHRFAPQRIFQNFGNSKKIPGLKLNLLNDKSKIRQAGYIVSRSGGALSWLRNAALKMSRTFFSETARLIFGGALAVGSTVGAAGLASSLGTTGFGAGVASAGIVATLSTVLVGGGIGAGIGVVINQSFFDQDKRWLDNTNIYEINHGDYDLEELLALLEMMLPGNGKAFGFKDKFTMKISKESDAGNLLKMSPLGKSESARNWKSPGFFQEFMNGNPGILKSGLSKMDVYSIMAMLAQVHKEGNYAAVDLYLRRLVEFSGLDRHINLAHALSLEMDLLRYEEADLKNGAGYRAYSGALRDLKYFPKETVEYIKKQIIDQANTGEAGSFRVNVGGSGYSILIDRDEEKIKIPFNSGNIISQILLSDPAHSFQLYTGKNSLITLDQTGRYIIFSMNKDDFEKIGTIGAGASDRERALARPLKTTIDKDYSYEQGIRSKEEAKKANQSLAQKRAEALINTTKFKNARNFNGETSVLDPSSQAKLEYISNQLKSIIQFDDSGRPLIRKDKKGFVYPYVNGIDDLSIFARDNGLHYDGKNITPEITNKIDELLKYKMEIAKDRKYAKYFASEQKMSASPAIKESNDLYWMIRNKVESSIFTY